MRIASARIACRRSYAYETPMTKNVTLRLDETVLWKARQLAVEHDQSLSQWVEGLIERQVTQREAFAAAKRRSLKRLSTGLSLGDKPLTREETHARYANRRK